MSCRDIPIIAGRLQSLKPLLQSGSRENDIELTEKKVMVRFQLENSGVESISDLEEDEPTMDIIKAYETLGDEPVINITFWGGIPSVDAVRGIFMEVMTIASECRASIIITFDDVGSFVIYSKTGRRMIYLFGVGVGLIQKSRGKLFSPRSFVDDMIGLNVANTDQHLAWNYLIYGYRELKL